MKLSRGERRSTAARLRGVGIDEVETLFHQRLFPIEHHPRKIDERLRIDKDPQTLKLVHTIALTGFAIKTNLVTQAGAATAGNSKAQSTLFGRDVLLGHSSANLRESSLRHLDTLGPSRSVVGRENRTVDCECHSWECVSSFKFRVSGSKLDLLTNERSS